MKTSKASIVQVTIHAKSAAASWPRDRSWTTEALWQGLHLGVLILAVLIGWLVSQDTSSRVESYRGDSYRGESYRGESYRAQPFEGDRIENDPIKDASAFRYIAFGGQTTEDPVPQSSCDCDGTGETNPSRLSLNPYSPLDSSLSEVWELSSRHLPEKFRCIDPQSPGLEALRRTETGWQRDDLESALVDDGRLTIVYVHGNFMERNNARERALILNQYLARRSERPYRLLMLSWPSTREPHPLRDVYENAESAECQALFVGWLLERLRDHSEVSLLGFSFGARAVTGGLHFAAGGTIPGFQYRSIGGALQGYDATEGSIESVSQGPRYRVALVAPAVDRSWLARGGKHAKGMESVSGLINLYNSQDPILRRFRFLDRLSRPVAAGFAGFVGAQGFEGIANPRSTEPLETSKKIRQFDCGSVIGTTHSERSYYAQCPYFHLVLDHLLGQESNANANVE